MFLYASAIVLTLAIPFERVRPAFTLPGQKVTNLEVVMLVAIAAWLVAVLRTRRATELSTPLSWPIAGLVVVMVASALVAGEHRLNALKFTARFVAGFCVFLLGVRVLSTPARALGLSAAMLATAVIVSIVATLEWLEIPAVMRWLTQFRPGIAVVGGHVRATSTLQYPTITSMYLEIAFALGLTLFGAAVHARRWIAAAAVGAALWLVGAGVVLTFTRAGLIVLVTILGLALVVWTTRRGFDAGVVALASLACAVVALMATSFTGGLQWLRLTTEQQQGWYRASYDVPGQLRLRTAELRLVEIEVRNEGRVTWANDDRTPFRLSYHWLDRDGRQIEFDGVRTPFESDVPPGGTVTVRARVRAPSRPGDYQLAWDVVQEQRLWFSTEGAPGPRTATVVEGEALHAGPTVPVGELPRARPRVGRLALWRTAVAMLWSRPLLGVGPDNFRLQYGAFAGLERADSRVHTNNLYLEFFTGTGLVGGALFLWVVWRLAREAGGQWRHATADRLPVVIGGLGAVVAILLHGLVDQFFEFTPTYLAIWIALAVFVSSPSPAPAVRGGAPVENANRV